VTRSFTYNGSDELAGQTRLASFRFTEAAYRGETGEGGFDFDDEGASADLVGLKSFTAEEDEATPARIFTGFIDDRGIGRGPYKTDADRQWQVSLTDLNAILDDIIIRTSTGNRPAETDVQRVNWLLTTGTMTPFGLDDSLVSSANPTPMEAADYRGRHPRDVLDECSEQSGKNFWVRDDGSGPFIFYDVETGSAYLSTASISNAPGEANGTTVFAPAWGDAPALSRDPARVYSGVRLEYGDGANVYVENLTTLGTFRQRETTLFDSAAKSASQATIIANQFLTQASTEEDTVEVPIIMERPYVTLFRAGMKVSTNFTHLGGTKSYRIARASVEPWEEHADQYLVTLSLRVPVKITRFGGRAPSVGELVNTISTLILGDAELEQGTSFTIPFVSTWNIWLENEDWPWDSQGVGVGSGLMKNQSWPSTPCGVGSGSMQYGAAGGMYRSGPNNSSPTHDDILFYRVTGFGPAFAHGADVDWQLSQKVGAAPVTGEEFPVVAGSIGIGDIDFDLPAYHDVGTTQLILSTRKRVGGGPICLVGFDPLDDAAIPDAGEVWGFNGVVYPITFASGTKGWSPLVAPFETPDGSNTSFTPIGWNGVGTPDVYINGLRVPISDYEIVGDLIVLAFPPLLGSWLLMRYRVGS
jgi:hypothetical protein